MQPDLSAKGIPIMKPIFAAAVFGLCAGYALSASATTIGTETRLVYKPIPEATVVDFRVFDGNRDNILSMEEVGEKLFYTFDKDGNQLVDNIEFTRPMVLTFAPMERITMQYVDFNNDGMADKTTQTQEQFMQQTGLSRFNRDGTGLAADEFIGVPFKGVDRDKSGQIDVREWKEVYIASLRALPQNETFRYND
jgi:Ca2+-binding EF-hand superfamily protein